MYDANVKVIMGASMTGIEVASHWAEETKRLCRLYQSLDPALEDLPPEEFLQLSRQIVTDLVFRIGAVEGASIAVEDTLTGISAVCQSCIYVRSTQPS